MSGSLAAVCVGVGVITLLAAGGWLLQQVPTRLDRAVAALSLEGRPPPAQEIRSPRERHRSERARRPARRPARPVAYDW